MGRGDKEKRMHAFLIAIKRSTRSPGPWTLDSGLAASPHLDVDRKITLPLPALFRGPIYHHAMKQVTSETAFTCPFTRAGIRSYGETRYSRKCVTCPARGYIG